MFDTIGIINTTQSFFRAAIFFIPAFLIMGILAFKSPHKINQKTSTAILLAFIFNVCSITLLNIIAIEYHFWTFKTVGAELFNIPIDLILSWAVLWSCIPLLIKHDLNIWAWAIILYVLDLLLMPLLQWGHIFELYSHWYAMDFLMILLCFVPGFVFAKITLKQSHLALRNLLQCLCYSMILAILCLIIDPNTIAKLSQYNCLPLQVLFLISVPALSSVQEFYLKGQGTPFPLDPSQRIIQTGPYAFISNPMQLFQLLIFIFLSISVNVNFIFLALVHLFYTLGFTYWSESDDFKRRALYKDWANYLQYVPRFKIRYKAYRKQQATLYLNLSKCDACSQLGQLLKKFPTKYLNIADINTKPNKHFKRITYIDFDGFQAQGIHAIARAFEHYNFLWAYLGFIIRLPIISHFLQIILDSIFKPIETNQSEI